MPKVQFIQKRFNTSSQSVIAQADRIIEDTVAEYRDDELFAKRLYEEDDHRRTLGLISTHFGRVENFVKSL